MKVYVTIKFVRLKVAAGLFAILQQLTKTATPLDQKPLGLRANSDTITYLSPGYGEQCWNLVWPSDTTTSAVILTP